MIFGWSPESELCFCQGNVLNAPKQYEEALAAYDKALDLIPNFASAWLGKSDASTPDYIK
jgi:tetratricopeptide (TPR) repeat protein